LTNVNQTAKASIRQAIWNAAPDLQLTERDVSLKKESAKDALDQIQRYMPALSAEKKKKKVSNAKTHLNSEIVQRMTPVFLTQADQTDEIRRWLRTVGTTLSA
jgi:hypothetical protein